MTGSRKVNAILVVVLCVAYFTVFVPPNALGAKTESMLAQTSVDEPVLYPTLVRMLTPAQSAKELFERWIIYGDYHYGYPFFFISSLAVLPVRLAYGALFTNHTGLNLLLLRQLISVLPMLAACVWMVYTVTRFRSTWQTFGLLAILLSVRGIVRANLQWWHPDGLSVLAVVLTLFFLERDRLRFGRNFYFAAAACGLAAGIKLAGFFFFLAVGGYLIAGLRQHKLTLPRAAVAGALYIFVMLSALIVSNPVVYNAGARQEIINIQIYKSGELDQGYTHDDPYYYNKGPQFWEWTLTRWFGSPAMLGFALFSLLISCFYGPNRALNRLILAWVTPYSIYLLWFVAVKPDHYWLPVIVPLYATLLNLPALLLSGLQSSWLQKPVAGWPRARWATLLLAALLGAFVLVNFTRPASGIIDQYSFAMQVENRLK